MATVHPAERRITQRMVGGLYFGIDLGILSDADLASTAAVAKAAVDLDNAKLHVAEKNFGPRVKASIDMVGNYDSTYLGGSDADKATMLAYGQAPYRGSALVF